jgi:hypothetical protein
MRDDGFHNICLTYCGEKLKIMLLLASKKSLTNSNNLLMTAQKSWIINSDAAVAKIFKIINCFKKQTFKLFLSFTRQPKHCKIMCHCIESSGLIKQAFQNKFSSGDLVPLKWQAF